MRKRLRHIRCASVFINIGFFIKLWKRLTWLPYITYAIWSATPHLFSRQHGVSHCLAFSRQTYTIGCSKSLRTWLRASISKKMWWRPTWLLYITYALELTTTHLFNHQHDASHRSTILRKMYKICCQKLMRTWFKTTILDKFVSKTHMTVIYNTIVVNW